MNSYNRYQLVYPFESNKIYKSKSLKKVAQKCYSECLKIGITVNTFKIMDLDKNIEYIFTINNKNEIRSKDIFDDLDIGYLQKMKNENNDTPFKWII